MANEIGKVQEWQVPPRKESKYEDLYQDLLERLMIGGGKAVLTVNFADLKTANNMRTALGDLFRRRIGNDAVIIRVRRGGACCTLYISRGRGWK